jgi:lipoprotein-anchoring transpeptidase ErfK/SrfK
MFPYRHWHLGGRGSASQILVRPPQFRRDNPEFLSKKFAMFRPVLGLLSIAALLPAVQGASTITPSPPEAAVMPPSVEDCPDRIVVSVREQKLMVVQNNTRVAIYPVSTSKYGIGDFWGRMTTPLGYLQVAQKIGDNAPEGAVFHNRRFTGEVLKPNAPGRDPIITRIIWLRGLERQNMHAFSRCIYIHGTPEERYIGRPASYGCIRMKSHDVATLYNQIPIGALVQIVPDKLPDEPKGHHTTTTSAATFAIPHVTQVSSNGREGENPAALLHLDLR